MKILSRNLVFNEFYEEVDENLSSEFGKGKIIKIL